MGIRNCLKIFNQKNKKLLKWNIEIKIYLFAKGLRWFMKNNYENRY